MCVLNQKWRYNGSDRMTDLVHRSNKGDSSLCRFITAFLSEKRDGGWKGSSLSRISYASFESPSLSLFNFMALRVLYCLYPLSSSFFLNLLSFCVIFRPIFALTVVLFFFPLFSLLSPLLCRALGNKCFLCLSATALFITQPSLLIPCMCETDWGK